MKNKKYYFLHDWDSSLDYSDGEIIPLFPNVAYELDKRGLSYQILEQRMEIKRLYPNVDEYFPNILEWTSSVNQYFKENIPECKKYGYDIGYLTISTLKYLVDALIVESSLVKGFLKSIPNDSEIIYVRARNHACQELDLQNYFRHEHTNWIYQLLLQSHKAYPGIQLSLHEFTKQEPFSKNHKFEKITKYLLKRYAKPLYKGAKSIRNWILSSKWRVSPADVSPDRMVLIFHSGSPHIDPFIKKILKTEGDCYFIVDGELIRHQDWIERSCFDLRPNNTNLEHQSIEEDCAIAVDQFLQSDALEFLDKICAWPVKSVVKPHLEKTLKNTFRDIICIAKKFRELFQEKTFDYVFATNSTDLYFDGFLLTQRSLPKQRDITCIQHGVSAFSNPLWPYTDLRPFDNYIASEPFSAKRFNKLIAKDPTINCRIIEDNHYFSSIKKEALNKRMKRINARSNRQTVLYVPSKIYSYLISLTVPSYTALWNYQYQKKLMDYFGTLKNVDLIFKESISVRNMSYFSIIPYIKKSGYTNIHVETKSVRECAGEADKIIVDRPLTASFEIAATGTPFICLTAKFIAESIDPDVLRYFAKCYQVFKDDNDLLRKIEEFLNSEGSEYCVDYNLNQSCFEEVFKSEKPTAFETRSV